MTTTSPSTPSTAPSADRSSTGDRSPTGERSVLMDLLAVSPADTLGRELFALVANIALIGLLVIVLRPEAVVAAVMLSLVTLFMSGRLIVGFRTRGSAASLRGER